MNAATRKALEAIKAIRSADEADLSALLSAIEQLLADSNFRHLDHGHGVREGLSDAQFHLEHYLEQVALEEAV